VTTTKTKPSPSPDPNTIFAQLLQDLPPETAILAREFKAFVRARKIESPEQLLRVVLLFAALDYSEREVAANMTLTYPAIGKLTGQSMRERLTACLPWLQALLPKLIQRPPLPALPEGMRLLALDASEISAPGARGTWRLHALMDVASLQLVGLQLTDLKTGETLCNFSFGPGEVVLTDRGYSHRRGVAHLLDSGGQVITRYNPHHIPLQDAHGQSLDMAALLADCQRDEMRTIEGFFRAPDGKRHHIWVHVYRLPEQAAADARRRCRRAGALGKYTPKERTLFLAEFVMVLTSIPPEVLSAETILELYRCRWQIELLFKRYKSLLDLDQARARAGSVLGQVWLHGKMLYACLIERRAKRRCGPEWTRLDKERCGSLWRVWRLIRDELATVITLSQCWDLHAWPAALTALAEGRRKRRLQRLPQSVVLWLQKPPAPNQTNGMEA
jgi:Transposase DDE domain